MNSSATTPNPDDYMTLQELNSHLSVCAVTANRLSQLGFHGIKGGEMSKQIADIQTARKFRSATLYKHSDFQRIKAAIARALNCAAGESYAVGDLMLIAPKCMPPGYSVVLTASATGHTLQLGYPGGTTNNVDCGPPLSSALKSAIECGRAHYGNTMRELHQTSQRNYS